MGRVSHTVIGEVWEGMTTVAGGGDDIHDGYYIQHGDVHAPPLL